MLLCLERGRLMMLDVCAYPTRHQDANILQGAWDGLMDEVQTEPDFQSFADRYDPRKYRQAQQDSDTVAFQYREIRKCRERLSHLRDAREAEGLRVQQTGERHQQQLLYGRAERNFRPYSQSITPRFPQPNRFGAVPTQQLLEYHSGQAASPQPRYYDVQVGPRATQIHSRQTQQMQRYPGQLGYRLHSSPLEDSTVTRYNVPQGQHKSYEEERPAQQYIASYKNPVRKEPLHSVNTEASVSTPEVRYGIFVHLPTANIMPNRPTRRDRARVPVDI